VSDGTDEALAAELIALRESEGSLRALIDHTPAPITLKGVDGRYQFMNRDACALLGLDMSETVGNTAHDIMPADAADILINQDREVLAKGEAVEFEFTIPHADGSERDLLGFKFPVFGTDGNVVGIGSVNLDITEHKKTEKARNEAEFFNKMAVGRELKMIELKIEVDDLLERLGEDPRYNV
jgi:two-component system cell cycle sensor histidine kinase/response regulator CckA